VEKWRGIRSHFYADSIPIALKHLLKYIIKKNYFIKFIIYFFNFNSKKNNKIIVTHTNTNLYYLLYKGQYGNLSITSIKHSF